MAYKDKKSTKLKSAFLPGLLRLVYWLPDWLVFGVSWIANKLAYFTNARSVKVARRNLELCLPELDKNQRQDLLKKYLTHSAHLAAEIPVAWLGSQQEVESRVTQVLGKEVLDKLVEAKEPVVVAVPHAGNWELFWMWLQIHYPAFGMYRAAKFEQLESMVLNSRMRFGGKGFAGDRKGIMGLVKTLKQGGVMMMLPDQVPQPGAGCYAPFFGHPAYTMTLFHRLTNKVNARLFFGSCIRQENGKDFSVHLEPANFEHLNISVEEFNQSMNSQMADIIRREPVQYVWNYKRFKRQEEGRNFYRGI